ncbi:MAG: hypothetical protein OXH31_06175 [Gammaproteobacteria bacterium]|nr:hypothetical protein [Gammaproteobacteria bacterium]
MKEDSIQESDLDSYRDFIPTIRKKRNEALTIARKLTIPMGSTVSLIFNAGYSHVNYRFDAHSIDAVVEYGSIDTAPVLDIFDIKDKYSETGHALLLSGGLEFQLRKQWKLKTTA